jgi:hypothetical protein
MVYVRCATVHKQMSELPEAYNLSDISVGRDFAYTEVDVL